MNPKCPTCGAPVNLAPDGDPRYDPVDTRAVIRSANQLASRMGSEISYLRRTEEKYFDLLRAVWCMGERVLPIGNYKPDQAPLICNDVAEAYHQMKASRGEATEKWGF